MGRTGSGLVACAAALLLVLAVRGLIAGNDSEDAEVYLRQNNGAGFQKAAALNPQSSAPLIGLGLLKELEGRPYEAERLLRQAALLDRGYLPRWTIAGFYLRHDDARAWPFLAEALRIAVHGGQDPSSLFEACWQFRPEPRFILNEIVGREQNALRLYLGFLLATERVSALPEAAMLLPADEEVLLLSAADRLLHAGNAQDARRIWNRVVPRSSAPELLTNTGFERPRQLGFDWRYNSIPECRVRFDGAADFEFTGRQPEILELLYEVVSLSAGSYTLRWQTKRADVQGKLGLFWQVLDAESGAEFFRRQLQPATQWNTEAANVTIPHAMLARLVLRSERLPGNIRFEGEAFVRHPSLTPK